VLKVEKGGNDRLSIEHIEEIKVIFHKSIDLLISSILNNDLFVYKFFMFSHLSVPKVN
jgi:hypothetical protein